MVDRMSPEEAVHSIPSILIPEEIPTPAAVVDLDVLESNITSMQQRADSFGVQLRPHVKTHKSVDVARLQLEAGAHGLTVGTLHEASVFAEAGFKDIFLATTVFPSADKISNLRAVHERATFRLGVDSVAAIEAWARIFSDASRPLEVLLEVDCGEHRTGVDSNSIVDLAAAATRAGLRVVGAYTYAGQGYSSPEMRQSAARDELDALGSARLLLEGAGFEVLVISAGSTPTFDYSSRSPVTEQRPGTYTMNDGIQVGLQSCTPRDVALRVASTVISNSAPGQVIIDAGTKAIAREPASFLDGLAWIPEIPGGSVWKVNDYHGYVRVPSAEKPAVGDRVGVVPNHACPVINMFDELYVVRRGKLEDVWPVSARGHGHAPPRVRPTR